MGLSPLVFTTHEPLRHKHAATGARIIGPRRARPHARSGPNRHCPCTKSRCEPTGVGHMRSSTGAVHSEALEKFTAQLGTSQFLLGSVLQALARRARSIVVALATRTRCVWHVACWHGVRCIVHLCLQCVCKESRRWQPSQPCLVRSAVLHRAREWCGADLCGHMRIRMPTGDRGARHSQGRARSRAQRREPIMPDLLHGITALCTGQDVNARSSSLVGLGALTPAQAAPRSRSGTSA